MHELVHETQATKNLIAYTFFSQLLHFFPSYITLTLLITYTFFTFFFDKQKGNINNGTKRSKATYVSLRPPFPFLFFLEKSKTTILKTNENFIGQFSAYLDQIKSHISEFYKHNKPGCIPQIP